MFIFMCGKFWYASRSILASTFRARLIIFFIGVILLVILFMCVVVMSFVFLFIKE